MQSWTDDFAEEYYNYCPSSDLKGCQVAFKYHMVYMEPKTSQKHVYAPARCVREKGKCKVEFEFIIWKRPDEKDKEVEVEVR